MATMKSDVQTRADVMEKVIDGHFRIALPGGILRAMAVCASTDSARYALTSVLLRVSHIDGDRFTIREMVATDGKMLGRWRDAGSEWAGDTFDVLLGAKEVLSLKTKLRWDSEVEVSATGHRHGDGHGAEIIVSRHGSRTTVLGVLDIDSTFPDYRMAIPEYPQVAELRRTRFASKMMGRVLKALDSVGEPDRVSGVCYCVDYVSEDRPARFVVSDGLGGKGKGEVHIYLMPMIVG